MRTINTSLQAVAAAALLAALGAPAISQAADATAAQALARKEKCLTCHSVDKAKDGPSFKSVAAKYKGKADAEDHIVKQLTSGPKVKFPDGHEEEHKVIKASAGDIKNVAQWILSQ